MEKSLKSMAINYGLYLGLFLSAFTIIGYVVKIELLVNFWLVLLLLPLISIIVGIISTAKAKKTLEGFISFRQAFSSYFITIAIGIIISSVVTVLIFNFIDPDAAITLKEIVIEKTTGFMEKLGAPSSEIEKSVALLEEQDTFGIGTQLTGLAKGLIFYAVIGLLVALVMRKKDPNAA